MGIKSTLFAALAMAIGIAPAIAATTGVEHTVQNGAVQIYVWEKYAGAAPGKRVVVLAHGSATAGRESFDLQVPGFSDVSLMDVLAEQGYDVFALDTRGFGRSTHPEGHITTAQASEDLNAVVDYVAKLRGVANVDVLAWSWGTQYGGMFVMAHPQKVHKYVAYAQMHLDSPDLAKRRQKIEVFRKDPYSVVPQAGWKPRFYSMTPASVNLPAIVDAYASAAALVETRTATGPQLDLVTIMPMINERMMTVPVMLIHGQYDDVADQQGLLPFFQALPNPEKRYVMVADGGHMMMFQKGRQRFQRAVIDFLAD